MTSALLVVDIQALTLPNATAVAAETLLANTAQLLARFRSAADPVAFAVTTGTPAGTTSLGPGGRVWPDAGLPIAAEVAPRDGEPVVRRAGWSAFAAPELDGILRAAGVDTVAITGLATSFGVESTARAAYDLGYSVLVVSDAVSDPDPRAHEHTLTRVVPLLGRVVTTAELLG